MSGLVVVSAAYMIMRIAGIGPAALEMMDALGIEAAEASVHAGYPEGAGAVLLVEVDGLSESVQEEAAEIEARRRGGRGQLHEALLPAGASPTTQAVLDFIRAFKKQEHLSPTIREIQIGCDLSSTSVAHYHLRLLEKSFGALTRKPGNSRSIVLAEEAR